MREATGNEARETPGIERGKDLGYARSKGVCFHLLMI
jgi:hypothetical protein